MPIPLITNFTINQAAPVDDRIVVTSSLSRDAIQYKYDGLTVFQTDTRSSWTWNTTSATWSYNVAGNGIYSGSGSIIGNTYINFGDISTGAVVNTTSNLLGYYSNLNGSSNIYYLNAFAVKKSSSPSSIISFKIQNSLNSTNYSYIEFNPDSTDSGALSFGNGTNEYLRISSTGKIGVNMTPLAAPYNTAHFVVNGIVSSNGIRISYNNNTSVAGNNAGFNISATSSGLTIFDSGNNSGDITPNGYSVLNISNGKLLIGGTNGVSSIRNAESRLEIYEPNVLGTITGNNLILKTITNTPQGPSVGNTIKVREYALRDKTYSTSNGWESWRIHSGISVDNSFITPATSKCFWERDPYTNRQWFGSEGKKTVEIETSSSISALLFRDISSNKSFKLANKQKITYIDDTSYIIEGVSKNVNLSGTIVNFIGLPYSTMVIVEAEFNSISAFNPSLGVTNYVNRQNSIRSVYNISNVGAINTVTANNTIFDYSAASSASGISINAGTSFTAGEGIAGPIALGQTYTGSGNFITNVKYKLYFISIPNGTFTGTLPTSGGVALILNSFT
jgi:hypothetical protein